MHLKPSIKTHGENQKRETICDKSIIPFVSIGAIHEYKQLNRLMKVHGCLTGISKNPNAGQRFFLTTPELACFAKDFKGQLHPARSQAALHYDFSLAKSNQSMGPSPESKKPLRAMGIHLVLQCHVQPHHTCNISQLSLCHRSLAWTTPVRSSTKAMCQR
jgi:hypothetical protein